MRRTDETRIANAAGRDRFAAGPHFRVDADPHDLESGVRLSLILPVHNEARVITRSVEKVLDYSARNPLDRFIFVDDGSTDGTPRLLTEALERSGSRSVSSLILPKNVGKGHAVKAAVEICAGRYIGFLDGDLAYSLDHLAGFLALLTAYDVVIGSRLLVAENRGRTIGSRRLMGRVFNFVVRRSMGLPFRDTQAGIKVFRASAARRLFAAQRLAGFGFDVELLYLAGRMGLSIAQTPVEVDPDHDYEAHALKLARNSWKMLREIAQIQRNSRLGLYPNAAGDSPAALRPADPAAEPIPGDSRPAQRP